MNLVAFDLETSGLKPWAIEIYSMAAYDTQPLVQKLPDKDFLRKWLQSTIDKDQYIVGWNLLFDVSCLLAYGLDEEVNACKWLDAMLLLKRRDPWRESYGLKQAVAETWPQYKDYAIDDFSRPTTEEAWSKLLEYNIQDVVFTLSLCQIYINELASKEVEAVKLESSTIPMIAKSWVQGISINTTALDELEESVHSRQTKCLQDLNLPEDVLSSTVKLSAVIYDQWGLPCITYTDKGSRSTSKDALNQLAILFPDDWRLRSLLEYRKTSTIKAKYVNAVRESIAFNKQPIVHPQPHLSGTYTGRLTYSSKQGKNKNTEPIGIALHQWNRDKSVRKLLQAPEGFLLCEWDFSGQEMRLMADFSQDDTMLSLFNNNIDGHAFMGGQITGKDWRWIHDNQSADKEAKQARYLGKFANLSLQYRIGIDKMRLRALTDYNLNLSEAEAKHIKATYMSTYQQVPVYWMRAIDKAAKCGYAETRGFRRVPLADLSEYSQQQTAINFPIQGTGGDMKILAISIIKNYLTQFGGYFAWDLHDALFVYLPDDSKAEKNALFIKKILSELPYEKTWGWKPSIPLPVDCKIGKNWGEMRDLHE